MRRLILFAAFIAFVASGYTQTLYDRLSQLPDVASVEQIAGGQFLEKYVVMFRQLRDPIGHPQDTATFLQRVIIGHRSTDSIVVLHTHGYSAADHSKRITIQDELAEIFKCNNIFIEHRYFGESCPADTNWNEVTTANAAYDMHRIITALKTIYPKKWISTGGSKDGITSTLLSMYYPDDIDIAVPYVAPFCLTTTDRRIIPFLQQVGTPEKRERIRNFQLEAWRRREVLEPRVEHYADSIGMRFTVPFEMIYDYCLLDYDFGIWMRGISEDSIPLTDASDDELFRHFIKYANPDMFDRAHMPHQTYYVQSAKELGNYAYDFTPFAYLLSSATLHSQADYLTPLYLPEGDWDFSYTDATRRRVMDFLRTTTCRLMFIYGGTDAWTAFAIDDPDSASLANPEHVRKYVLPDGCHYTKIRQFDEKTQAEILDTLHQWLRH